ncbi:DNA alkylation repair protein [Entamoeba marina]
MNLNDVVLALDKHKDDERAKIFQRFFKTQKGGYGEGDVFIGIQIPPTRALAKKSFDDAVPILDGLINDKIHERRILSGLILVLLFDSSPKEVYEYYLAHTERFNNWDLVDLTAPYIVGKYLLNDKKRDILYRLAVSKCLWEKRIAMVSTITFIRNKQFKDTFKLCEILKGDSHDLIHKACGWMIREVGKKNVAQLKKYLNTNINTLARTTVRYAIEKFDEPTRQKYLKLNKEK